MRLLAVAAVLLLVLLVALAVVLYRDRARRRWDAAVAGGRWEDAHYPHGGTTVVAVRQVARLPSGEERVLGESVVDRIPDGDPRWHERFSAARQTAYDRAIDLNTRPLLG